MKRGVSIERLGWRVEMQDGRPVVVDTRHICIRDEEGNCTPLCHTDEVTMTVGHFIETERARKLSKPPKRGSRVNPRMMEMFVPPLPDEVLDEVEQKLAKHLPRKPWPPEPRMN